MNLFARTVPSASAFPERKAGRLLHYPFRGLLSVHSRYGLHAHRVAIATLFTEGFNGFVTSTAAPIVTGRNEPAPGRDFHPLWTSAFPRRTLALGLTLMLINRTFHFEILIPKFVFRRIHSISLPRMSANHTCYIKAHYHSWSVLRYTVNSLTEACFGNCVSRTLNRTPMY